MVKVNGFNEVRVEFAKKQALVTYDPDQIAPEKLADAVRKGTGFTVTVGSDK
ncbi:MAG: heavy-metal-associated domain-containing protein [Armatimonadetes bacterium]|nr:heavy-metal-associated domain-containing protein [Armatimonadota bacterium]